MLVNGSLMTGKLNLTWSLVHWQTHVGKLTCASKYYNISYTMNVFFKRQKTVQTFDEIYRNYFRQYHILGIGIFYGLQYKANLTRARDNREIQFHFTDLADLNLW